MVFGFAGPLLTAGAGSTIPMSGGSAESGDIGTTVGAFGPVNIGSGTAGGTDLLIPALVVGAVILGYFFLRRK